MRKFLGLALLTVSVLALLFWFGVNPAFAQVDPGTSAETVAGQAGLQDADLTLIIAQIIRAVLGFLGILAIIIVLWGGFIWMTAGGNPEKIERAKKILINGGIGLVIVWTSFGIASFVISQLLDATGATGGTEFEDDGGGPGLGGGPSNTFSVSGYSPEGDIPIRNAVLKITFSRTLEDDPDEQVIDDSLIVITDDSGDDVAGTYEVTGNKVEFTPSTPCPAPNEDRFCFDEFTTYSVAVSSGIISSSGTSLSCTAGVGCESSFTTGDVVDVDDPTASITFPESNDRLEPGVPTLVQVSATDDFAVSLADFFVEEDFIDSVTATGADLSDVTIETTWNTAGYEEDQTYTIEVTVYDLANNTDTDTQTVRIDPAHCYNGVQDEDETGEDCGGSCGSCAGDACVETADCADGMQCIDSVCVEYPTILDVSPPDGAVGTYVSVTGVGFGNSEGVIQFSDGAGGFVDATIPACADGWNDEQIIVEVPEGAGSGPIALETSGGVRDSSDDDWGPIVEDFVVNSTVRPALCNLSPDDGDVGREVRALGINFGSSQEDSVVNFGDTEAIIYNEWGDDEVKVDVPTASAGEVDVRMIVDGVESNKITFEITEEDVADPHIVSVDPETGGIGQYVTIAGTDFGTQIGTVWFESTASGYVAQGSTAFPEECADDFWSDDQITIIVPEEYTNGEAVETTIHNIYIETQGGNESDTIEFTVTTADPTPGICSITPDAGEEGDDVTVYGANFGSDQGGGTVSFYNEANVASVESWSNDEIALKVPGSASTGPVDVKNDSGDESNNINFEIGSEDGAGGPVEGEADYVWTFSTGEIPATPEVVFACEVDDDTGLTTRVSGVPNQLYTSDVCVNAMVNVDFTVLMDDFTFVDGETVLIEECDDASCDSATVVNGDIVMSDNGSYSTMQWTPAIAYNEGTGDFITETTYRITISDGVLSADGVALARNESWEFATGTSADDCAVEEVVISPQTDTITAEGESTEYNALAATSDCQVLNSDDYTWSWQLQDSIASLGACEEAGDSCRAATALIEGETLIDAREDDSGVIGSGTLIVDYTDPYVTNHWPGCSTACINASVGASFNVGMDVSIENSGMATLYACDNELCTTYTSTEDSTATCILSDIDGDGDDECAEIALTFNGGIGDVSTFYRVVISGNVTSESGVPLSRANFGDDYSWVFSTKDDETLCTVTRIDLEPDTATLRAIGEKQNFVVDAFGAPDSCSEAGQKLEAYSYEWDWQDPIVDNSDVAEWRKSAGELWDGDPLNPKAGCTSSCLSQGSQAFVAVCGDGVIGTGEDCDDGNVTDGDGCSSVCLGEGNLSCSQACSISGLACTEDADCGEDGGVCEISGSGCCGDGSIDRDAGTGAGEECDDGNIQNGDGCSAQCLNEGSTAIGSVCGNNDVAYDSSKGGEDCDDGNTKGGDGCSAQCLNEGSIPNTDIVAVCGDGVITNPYETCDDGNADNGDGCSEFCLREGGNVVGAVCGDGVTTQNGSGAGEDCDFTVDAGCTINCTFAGSSISHDPPSVCGDGKAGSGEYALCEAGLSGDGKTDPGQRATISDSAAEQVDLETNIATATIRAGLTEFGLIDEATLNLSCSAEIDSDCPSVTEYGVANNSCCMERPDDVSVAPSGGGNCRNAAIYADFDREMDLDSFTDTAYVLVNTATTGGVCPGEYTVFAQKGGPVGWFARAWANVRNFFIRIVNAQSSGDCLLPLSGFTQVEQDDGTFRVYFDYTVLLEEGATYFVVIPGDQNLNDDESEGVLSSFGVGMNGDAGTKFGTGSEICTLDSVEVEDTDSESPYFYSSIGEAHDFQATTFTFNSGVKSEIQSVPGVYEWAWNDWKVDDATVLNIDSMSDDTSTISAPGTNGDANVVASATIVADELGDTVDETVSGDADVTVLLCENPWPAPEDLPFIDDATGTVDGTDVGKGWTNFSTYYCRDSGEEGTSDDLADVTVVAAPERASTGRAEVFKEYIFIVNDESGDAIGARVVSNEDYLDIDSWYANEGFAGSPAEIQIDGYEALRDGRTLYVSAPNQANSLYSNVYVFSYNEGASLQTQQIFDDFISNLTFNTNLEDVNLCHNGVDYTTTECASDLDCGGGEVCGSDKDKLRRDNIRLTDVTEISNALGLYSGFNGLCSATTTQTCSADADCPAGESCESAIPTLSAGTFVPGMTSSIWSSWADTFESVVGELPEDPLNQYVSCGEDPFADYSSENCVTTAAAYVCPEGSYTYHFRAVGPFAYQLAVDLEYLEDDWVNAIDPDTSDNFEIQVGGNVSTFPDGFTGVSWCDCPDPNDSSCTVYGASEFCGDGILGPSEACELGQAGASQSCDVDPTTDSSGDGDPANDADGSIAGICNSSCSAFEANPGATCTSPTCGNGTIEAGEECDDGSFNGSYGFCGSDCSYASAFYCGDGSVGGGEVCDCGVDSSSGLTFGGLSCSTYGVVNGDYKTLPNRTCAWDCAGPASHCGDLVVDSSEQCDGDIDTWSGNLCNGGSNDKFPCSSDDDCAGGGSCGSGGTPFESCPETTVCLSGDVADIGYPCTTNSDCGTDGVCSTFDVQTIRTRTCGERGGGNGCNWEQNDWHGIDCVAAQSCGDGVTDPGEECDDGNEDDTDSCTNVCTNNICGDGYLYDGVEECDDGALNGELCTPAYGSTCTYCTTECRTVSSSGAFCGNGTIESDEFCDADDLQYYWYRAAGGGQTFGNCDASDAGSTFEDGDGITWTCRNPGICNGGSDNGTMCLSNGNCDSGQCVKPTCADSCGNSCPFTYETDALLMETNATGSRRSSAISLISFDPEEAEGEVLTIGNSATMYFPSCDVATTLTANVNWDNVERPDVYVIFLVDKSGSMSWAIDGGTEDRWEVASDVIVDGVERLYDELGDKVHISLVSYTSEGGSCEGVVEQTPGACSDGFCEEGSESSIVSVIEGGAFDPDSGGCGTPTGDGIEGAEDVMDTVSDTSNVRKLAILLTDGESSDDPTSAANSFKNAGYELYTVALTTDSALISDTNDLSSGNPDPDTGIDYAYDGNTAEDLEAVYSEIIASITQATVKIITSASDFVTGTVGEGNGVSLPWPEGFECDGENEQGLPFQITFQGEGYIDISNVNFEFCKP